MKKIVTIIALLLGIHLYAQKGNESLCRWHAEGSDEMSIPADNYQFFKKGNFYYYLANDNQDLYLDLKIEDSGVQYKVLQEGMNVWINPDGKSTKKTGFRFPIGAKSSKPAMMRDPGNNVNPESPIAMAHTIELIGLSDSKSRMVPADGSEKYQGSVKYSKEGDLYYCLRIPLSEINSESDRSGKEKPELCIGIEYGAPPAAGNPQRRQAPQAQQSSDNFASSSGRGGGSRGGGSRGGGGRSSGGGMPMGGMPGARTQQTGENSTILWVKNVTFASAN